MSGELRGCGCEFGGAPHRGGPVARGDPLGGPIRDFAPSVGQHARLGGLQIRVQRLGVVLVCGEPVQRDDPCRGMRTGAAAEHEDALVDLCVLRQVPVTRGEVRQDRVQVQTRGQPASFREAGGGGGEDRRGDHGQNCAGVAGEASLAQYRKHWANGVLVHNSLHREVRLAEHLLEMVGSVAEIVLGDGFELLAHLGAVREGRVHGHDPAAERGVHRAFEVGVVGQVVTERQPLFADISADLAVEGQLAGTCHELALTE